MNYLIKRERKELNFTINQKNKILRGEIGETAIIAVNGEPADINTSIKANDMIVVIESTAGASAKMEISKLAEYNATLNIEFNEKKLELPKFASVNGELKSGYYEIQDMDNIEILNYFWTAYYASHARIHA